MWPIKRAIAIPSDRLTNQQRWIVGHLNLDDGINSMLVKLDGIGTY